MVPLKRYGAARICQECGSPLFWKGDGRDYTAIAAGSIDGKLGVTLEGHIFCDSAGDYYQITGGRFRHLDCTRSPSVPNLKFASYGVSSCLANFKFEKHTRINFF